MANFKMTKINRAETILVGRWIPTNNGVEQDDVCRRIDELTHHHLIHLGTDSSGWKSLYRDPDDGRLWELTYADGEMHGAGAPQLQHLTKEAGKKLYPDLESQIENP